MNNRQSLFAILTFLTLLATMVTHQFGSRRYQRLAEAREKSDNRREALMNLRVCITDAETGYRGYLLADDIWYKETYTKAEHRFSVMMDALEDVYDRKSLEALAKLATMRMELIRQCISLFDRGLKQEAFEFMRAGEGKRVMDDFRAEAARMRTETLVNEQKLDREFQESSTWLLNGLGLMHLIILVLIAVAMIPESGLKEILNRKKNE